MLRYFKYIFLFSIFASCSKGTTPSAQESEGSGVGYLSTSFEQSVDSSTNTKSTTSVDTDKFIIRVKSQSSDEYVYQSEKQKISDLLELNIGDYTIEADYPEVKSDAAFNEPHYYGEVNDIEIFEDQITEVAEISTSISNAMVTVEFSDLGGKAFSDLFKTYYATVSNDNGSLIFTGGSSQEGYFTLSTLNVLFSGTRIEDGSELEIDLGSIESVAAADHHNIIITLDYDYNEPASTDMSNNTKSANNSDWAGNSYQHTFIID